MSHSTTCLNCESSTNGKFCSNCGQKTDTHRITFKHFVVHDILHGVWHFEKGLFFTLKEAFLRPGKAALEYISGKRIKYYNVFYLTLIVIGLMLFINHTQNELSHYYFGTELKSQNNAAGKKMDNFLGTYSKLIIFSFVPLFAINSFLIFKRKKLNLSEHFIISGMIFLGIIIINFISTILFFLEYVDLSIADYTLDVLNILTPLSILLFLVIHYYRVFSDSYTKSQNSIRVILFVILLLLEIALLMLLLFGYSTDWTFKLKYAY